MPFSERRKEIFRQVPSGWGGRIGEAVAKNLLKGMGKGKSFRGY